MRRFRGANCFGHLPWVSPTAKFGRSLRDKYVWYSQTPGASGYLIAKMFFSENRRDGLIYSHKLFIYNSYMSRSWMGQVWDKAGTGGKR